MNYLECVRIKLRAVVRDEDLQAEILSLNDAERLLVSWRGLSGLVVQQDDGVYLVKVSAVWGEEDKLLLDDSEKVADILIELFKGFWRRRGIVFEKP